MANTSRAMPILMLVHRLISQVNSAICGSSNPVSARIQGLLLARDGRSDDELAVSIYGSELRQPLVRGQCALLVRLGQIERRTRPDGRVTRVRARSSGSLRAQPSM